MPSAQKNIRLTNSLHKKNTLIEAAKNGHQLGRLKLLFGTGCWCLTCHRARLTNVNTQSINNDVVIARESRRPMNARVAMVAAAVRVALVGVRVCGWILLNQRGSCWRLLSP